jgi:hypothetical protein
MGKTNRREFLERGVAVATVTATLGVQSASARGVDVGADAKADAEAEADADADVEGKGEGEGEGGREVEGSGLQVSNRVHLYARPAVKEKLAWCFSTVLGCGAPLSLNAVGLAEPILAFRFPGGGSLSIEFTDDALDETQARRGAWLEIWASDPAALKATILAAGLPQVHYAATNTFYFAAPGGQVFGVVSARQPSAGELRTKPEA